MPAEIGRRRTALVNTFGTGSSPAYAIVQDMQHRDVDVLMLYPLDLVAVEERFGSWMAQYAYTNYVTAAKLLERGRVNGKVIEMAGRKFTTLVAMFEPFPSKKLLDMMKQFAGQGGRVIWSGPPPVLTFEGEPALPVWQDLFGVDYEPGQDEGVIVPGREVRFEGTLMKVAPQMILTDFLVDRIYPVRPRPGTATVAKVRNWIVGAQKGNAVFLGYRPRDDQAQSLGYDVRNWFEVLRAAGAYAGSDNTEVLSRTGKYLACRFPNGAVAVAPHLKDLEEDWPGGFARDTEADKKWVEKNPLPPETFTLKEFKAGGHTVTYSGAHALSFRVGAKGELAAFSGRKTKEISVDGRRTVFADREMEEIAWAPVAKERLVEGGAVMQILVSGEGTVRIPASGVELVAEGTTPGSRGAKVESKQEGGALVFTVTGQLSGKWIYGVKK